MFLAPAPGQQPYPEQAQHVTDRESTWYNLGLFPSAFVALVINAPHLEILQTGEIFEAFPLSITSRRSRIAVLTTPAVQNLERVRDEEPKSLAAPDAGLSYALPSGDSYSGQNPLSLFYSTPGLCSPGL